MTQIAVSPADGPATNLERVGHWIGGRPVAGTSGRSGPVFDPATGVRAREVDFASVDEVDAAVAAAKAAFPGWRGTSLSKRAEIMFRLRELVDANRKEIATLLGIAPQTVANQFSTALGSLRESMSHKAMV